MRDPVPFYRVDAFATKPFAGNPAGVCLLPEPRTEAWMQRVATELNFADTAFLLQQEDGFHLRWFTPAAEVDLCGHATLASAHVLWEAGYLPPDAPARFSTRSGRLTAERRGDWIEMDFPAEPAAPLQAPEALTGALDVAPVYVGKNRFDYLVEVGSEAVVRGLRPDLARLATVPCRGVIVTSRCETPGCDFVSRVFLPRFGIDEDPVTGSAHCCLGPYWGSQLGRQELVGCQASARGGVVRVRLAGERVFLSGEAVTVVAGELRIE